MGDDAYGISRMAMPFFNISCKWLGFPAVWTGKELDRCHSSHASSGMEHHGLIVLRYKQEI